MKKAMVTGSSGFIGRKLIKRLQKDGVEVVGFSRKEGKNITKKEDFAGLGKVDTVFHLAAVSGYKDCAENTGLAYEVNVGGTTNVLEYCRKSKAKLIFPSTYVYDQPYSEVKTETSATKPTTHYSFTKFLGEELCRFYTRVFKVNSLILRTANVFGFGQEDKYLVPIIFNNILAGREFELTKPEIERSFIYIADLVEAYVRLAEANSESGETYNIGPEKPTTLQELVQAMEKVTGKKARVKYSGQERPNEVNLNRVDTGKMKAKLNWQPEISLEQGLKQYLEKLHEV
ncbi:MAG: NAD(P)-dependent oxidoreductase [Candidatus Beckwithbacteria bacterium]|nr:NAD(P)-dependent oxidoreductase [Candidatus Beckwithbacteria bacterium]